MEFEHTVLWKNGFQSKNKDIYTEKKNRLSGAFLRMRDNVSQLISTVPADCKNLTVHDVTHIDALWELGSLIAGDEFVLNPAETFVFGASLLIHDAGLSSAAFAGGLAELKRTPEWSAFSAVALRQSGITLNADLIENPSIEIENSIKFPVLRALHAKQAQKMATAHWKLREDSDPVYIIEDVEIRNSLGSIIGRVAHSHNWDIAKVAEQLSERLGASTFLPSEWAINEKKIACLLRCADAAHFDSRRAPTMMMASIKPTGYSAIHWTAQNKINKPTLNGAALIYNSGSSFSASESEAWWLCYDLINQVDKELKNSNALLEEMGVDLFRAQRVIGAGNPNSLKSYVKVEGWRPVQAEIKVSDPVHLAKTLGGKNLYGNSLIAPIKEVLQNSVDAIRARRAIEDRPVSWGKIHVTVEDVGDSSQDYFLHIDDNGIGMTERVLTGPLVDFGKSIWNSSILSEEFPGIEVKSIRPIGKFGIGFFSLFMLTDHVTICSKKYDSGAREAKSLEFRSLATRPLLRDAYPNELPRDFSTRVTLRISNRDLLDQSKFELIARKRFRDSSHSDVNLENFLLNKISFVDVEIEFENRISGKEFVHYDDVYTKNSEDFIDELLSLRSSKDKSVAKAIYSDTIRPLKSENGRNYGRAALMMLEPEDSYTQESFSFVSVGGFTHNSKLAEGPYIGVFEGETDEAARQFAFSTVPKDIIAKWASEQAILVKQSKFSKTDLMRVCNHVLDFGGDSGPLPFCFYKNKTITYSQTRDAIEKLDRIHFHLSKTYEDSVRLNGYNALDPHFFEFEMHESLFITLNNGNSTLISGNKALELARDNVQHILPSDLNFRRHVHFEKIYQLISKVWGVIPNIKVERAQLFGTKFFSNPMPELCIVLSKL